MRDDRSGCSRSAKRRRTSRAADEQDDAEESGYRLASSLAGVCDERPACWSFRSVFCASVEVSVGLAKKRIDPSCENLIFFISREKS